MKSALIAFVVVLATLATVSAVSLKGQDATADAWSKVAPPEDTEVFEQVAACRKRRVARFPYPSINSPFFGNSTGCPASRGFRDAGVSGEASGFTLPSRAPSSVRRSSR